MQTVNYVLDLSSFTFLVRTSQLRPKYETQKCKLQDDHAFISQSNRGIMSRHVKYLEALKTFSKFITVTLVGYYVAKANNKKFRK
jgi:hypothetical protein